ncbi:hypothetical protein TSMEX_002363 [Taenia solium]|eukprot:TsM_000670800 transcript=TsM_000670800 gene=TsM_000670800
MQSGLAICRVERTKWIHLRLEEVRRSSSILTTPSNDAALEGGLASNFCVAIECALHRIEKTAMHPTVAMLGFPPLCASNPTSPTVHDPVERTCHRATGFEVGCH